MSKKIGIITFQNADNYGAVLQAYALQETLKKMGNEVEIINYDSPQMGLKSVQFDAFKKFNGEYLNLTQEYNSGDSIVTDDYDLLIAGSDQIWNPEISGNDATYFFRNKKGNARVASYAASIGLTGKELLKYSSFFAENLKGIEAISIRENSQKDFVEMLSGKSVNVNIDPTLLLDMQEYCEKFGVERKTGDYIFLYTNNVDVKIVDFVNVLSAYTGMKVIAVTNYHAQMFTEGSESYGHVYPVQWLQYIAEAGIVITDSFHGLMFSLIFEKNFYIYSKKRTNISRITGVLEKCKLEDRTLKHLGTVDDVSYETDFTAKRIMVKEEKEKALEYLRGLL